MKLFHLHVAGKHQCKIVHECPLDLYTYLNGVSMCIQRIQTHFPLEECYITFSLGERILHNFEKGSIEVLSKEENQIIPCNFYDPSKSDHFLVFPITMMPYPWKIEMVSYLQCIVPTFLLQLIIALDFHLMAIIIQEPKLHLESLVQLQGFEMIKTAK